MTHLSTRTCNPVAVRTLPKAAQAGGSWPAMLVVFPGFGPAAVLKPNLKLRSPTPPAQTIKER